MRSREETAFKCAFPTADLDNCLILQHGRTPLWNQSLLAIGVILIVLGLLLWAFFAWLFWPERKKPGEASG